MLWLYNDQPHHAAGPYKDVRVVYRTNAHGFRSREIDLAINHGARIYCLPCIAGHVGADAAGATLSEGPHRQDKMMLLVDVGTNAEILLGNKTRVLACSSPTGPAFEGAQISSGQRAAPGAIERVEIDTISKEPRFRVIGTDLWSDDPGFAAATASSGITGICGSGIIEAVAEMRMAGLVDQGGLIGGLPLLVDDGVGQLRSQLLDIVATDAILDGADFSDALLSGARLLHVRGRGSRFVVERENDAWVVAAQDQPYR